MMTREPTGTKWAPDWAPVISHSFFNWEPVGIGDLNLSNIKEGKEKC
jgi:hypothetical protein